MKNLEAQTIKKITKLVGSKNVLTSGEDLLCYAYDGTVQRGVPELVVFPTNTTQIVKIMQMANEEGFPVFPRGAGTGLSGGSVPKDGGVALVMSKMNHIKEISLDDCLAVVEPGVLTGELHRAVEAVGLFYPPDPASLESCTIGGNVAENAGGPRAFKYGVTKDYVLGLEVVTPTGELMRCGGRTVKNVTGYNLTGLLTGSEGTLGIVTEITLKLLPLPAQKRTALVGFASIDDAARTVSAIVKAGVIPATLEMMDNVTIRCVENKVQMGLPTDVEAILLIEVDGSPAQVNGDIKMVEAICQEHNCAMIQVATKQEDRDRLWQARRAVSSAIVQLNPTKISEDATVPRSRIPDMVRALRQIAEKYQLQMPIFGHAGDGNLHPNIVTNKENKEEMERVEQAIEEIFQAALSMDGTLSGEHGIGLMKKPYMEMAMGKEGLDYLRAIKRAVDPNNILNPGKVF